jgi:hypothetical protein
VTKIVFFAKVMAEKEVSLMFASRMILTVVAIAAAMALPSTARAEKDTFGPARIRLIVNLAHRLPHELEVRAHLIPAPNLLGELAPLGFLGLHWAPANWFGAELVMGYNWGAQEAIVSLRLNAQARTFWAWGDVEFRLPSGGWYYFFQVEWQPLRWLAIGGETEGWGPIDGRGSNGGGPNILIGFPPWGHVAFAIHIREGEGDAWGEFFARLVVNIASPPPDDPPADPPLPEPNPPVATQPREHFNDR